MILQAVALSQSVTTGIQYAIGAFGVVVAWPFLKIAREYGSALKELSTVVKRIDDIAPKMDAIASTLDRHEYILTGDEGVNGIRGDVQRAAKKADEVHRALIEQGQAQHTRLGDWSHWRDTVDAALVELRRPKRRQTAGRRTGERT
jgi:hypothetical protein